MKSIPRRFGRYQSSARTPLTCGIRAHAPLVRFKADLRLSRLVAGQRICRPAGVPRFMRSVRNRQRPVVAARAVIVTSGARRRPASSLAGHRSFAPACSCRSRISGSGQVMNVRCRAAPTGRLGSIREIVAMERTYCAAEVASDQRSASIPDLGTARAMKLNTGAKTNISVSHERASAGAALPLAARSLSGSQPWPYR